MKKLASIAFLGAALFAANAMAGTVAEEANDVKASAGAVHKDNAAIEKQKENLAVNRAEKADAKARGDIAAQAGNSIEIGANKAMIKAKAAEKNVDQKILEEDKEDLNEAVNETVKH